MPETTYLTNVIQGLYSTHAKGVKSLNIDENCMLRGYSFSASDYFDLAPTASVYIHFTGNSSTRQILFEPLKFTAVDAGPVTIDYYANVVLTAGGRTPIFTYNRNPYAFVAGVTQNATLEFVNVANISDIGVKFRGTLIPSLSGLGVSSGLSAIGGGGLPLVVYTPDDYVIKITNTDTTDTATIEFDFTWIESPTQMSAYPEE